MSEQNAFGIELISTCNPDLSPTNLGARADTRKDYIYRSKIGVFPVDDTNELKFVSFPAGTALREKKVVHVKIL